MTEVATLGGGCFASTLDEVDRAFGEGHEAPSERRMVKPNRTVRAIRNTGVEVRMRWCSFVGLALTCWDTTWCI